MAKKRISNKIQGVWNDQGSWINNQDDIASSFCSYYRKIFTPPKDLQEEFILERISRMNLPNLKPDQIEWLNKPFSTAQIRKAAFQIGPHKSPGIDDKPGIFYKKFWHIVGNLTTSASLHFLNTGFLLKELNKSLVALILKVECPSLVSHYKPISLCNFSYKIISIAIVNRLMHVMDSIVTPFQSVFIKRRMIFDNIILRSELFDTIKKKKTEK